MGRSCAEHQQLEKEGEEAGSGAEGHVVIEDLWEGGREGEKEGTGRLTDMQNKIRNGINSH